MFIERPDFGAMCARSLLEMPIDPRRAADPAFGCVHQVAVGLKKGNLKIKWVALINGNMD